MNPFNKNLELSEVLILRWEVHVIMNILGIQVPKAMCYGLNCVSAKYVCGSLNLPKQLYWG